MDILRKNSEAVLDIAQQGSNLRRKHNLEAQWKEDMKKPRQVRLDGRPVLGPKDAKIKMVAFSDFTCHFCEQASKTVDKLLNEFPNEINLTFKHMPLDEKGPGGIASAYFIAIAQQDENKAWEFYKKMFAHRENLLADGEPFIKKTAKELDLDMKKLEKDVKGKKVKEIMTEDQEDAQKLGVEGTPYFLVNNLVVRGALPPELFRNAIEMAKTILCNINYYFESQNRAKLHQEHHEMKTSPTWRGFLSRYLGHSTYFVTRLIAIRFFFQ